MGLINKKVIPPREWYHNPLLKDNATQLTVYDRFIKNKIPADPHWIPKNNDYSNSNTFMNS